MAVVVASDLEESNWVPALCDDLALVGALVVTIFVAC